MVSSFTSQTWAIARRYFLTCLRYPTTSVIRLLIWPGLFLGLSFYILQTSSELKSILMPEYYTAMILSSSLILHIYHFINWLVIDKTTEFKSLMVLMGLRKKSYYFGTALCMFVCLLPILVVSIAMASIYLFQVTKTSPLVVACIIIIFGLQLSSMLFFLASFITSTRVVYFVPVLVVMERFLHDGLLWVMKEVTGKVSQPIILFLFSFSPFEAVRIFCDSYIACSNCDDGPYFYPSMQGDPKFEGSQDLHDHVSQPIYQLIPAMLFWTAFYQLFSYWFDEICPYKTDSEIKNPFFCLQFGCSNSKFHSYSSGRNGASNPNLFEMSANANREVGIQVKSLTKIFNNIPVVNNLNFSIYKGETTLLLGHNGAGKTTLMNMILHKITPDHGRVEIGKKKGRETSSGIGVCPQESILDDNLTVRQHLEIFAGIKNCEMTNKEQSDHIKSTLADVSLTDHADFLPEKLSGGMKRKLSLGMAFVGNSNILILDEPSSGLDPDSRVFVWDVIRRYRAERTVLLSTQHMEEADYLGDRIAIMSEGTIICCGSSLFLNKTFGTGYKLRIECDITTKPKVLNFVRSFFGKAKIIGEDELQSTGSTVDFVVELNDDKKKDLELKLITMLEKMEEKASQDLRIKSHGLRSSSIEDVMLNTSKWLHSSEPSPKESTRLTIPLENKLSNLATPIQTQTDLCQIVSALLLKHLQIYKNDWLSILVFRLLFPCFCIWLHVYSYNFSPIFFPSIFASTLILHYIQNPSDERQSGFKMVQLASNANMLHYWLSQFLMDSISFLVNVILFNLIFKITFSGALISSELTVHLIISVGVLMFSLAGALMAYTLASSLSNTHSPMGIFSIFFIVSIGLSLIIYIVVLVSGPKMAWFYYLRWIFISTLPSDAFSYILYGLGVKCYISLIADSCTAPISLNHSPVVVGFIILAAQIVVYGILLYLVETQRANIGAVWSNLVCACCSRGVLKSHQRGERIDQDVLDESEKAEKIIRSVDPNSFSLVATDLNKSYVRGVKVIDNLSFAVERGECFGLLGVNGAGKSTTFSMIVAETRPDFGSIWLNGHYNTTSNIDSYRQTLGYDPQPNPDISLTPIEAFTLMARLRGVQEDLITRLVDSLLEVLDMNEHRNKKARNLSGGTKRKLGLGMSLIGNPMMLVLDEPTAGVDPMARRGVWRLLRLLRMQNNASILISSHAMEECEAICNRISIMAKGRLECIGTFLHLRNKFSQGCSIRVQFEQAAVVENQVTSIINQLNKRLHETIGQATVKLVDTNANSATFNVLNDRVRRSQLFKILREFRQSYPHLSYTINDSSLEDIFLKMAKKQELTSQVT